MKKYFPLFVGPTLLIFTIVFIIPFALGIYLSFTNFRTVTDAVWVGFENYVHAFNDPTFVDALWFTIRYTLVSVVTINFFAFILALLLTKGIKGTNLFRTTYFMPNMIGGIVLGYVWLAIINSVLYNFGVTITYNPAYGFWGLIIMMNWQLIGYMMIIYISGIQNIPQELFESAQIDGASPIQTFFQIILPILKPTVITVAILNAMWIWNDFLLPYLVLGSQYQTIPIAIQYLQGSYGNTDYGALMALLVLSIIPVIIFYLSSQKYIISGITAGAVKG